MDCDTLKLMINQPLARGEGSMNMGTTWESLLVST